MLFIGVIRPVSRQISHLCTQSRWILILRININLNPTLSWRRYLDHAEARFLNPHLSEMVSWTYLLSVCGRRGRFLSFLSPKPIGIARRTRLCLKDLQSENFKSIFNRTWQVACQVKVRSKIKTHQPTRHYRVYAVYQKVYMFTCLLMHLICLPISHPETALQNATRRLTLSGM